MSGMSDRSFEDRLNALRPELVQFAQRQVCAMDAEDAVQLATMWIWDHRGDFKEPDEKTGNSKSVNYFRSWVFSSLRRTLLNVIDDRKRYEHKIAIAEDLAATALPPDDETEKLIARLADEPERETLWDYIAMADLSVRQVDVLQAKLRGEHYLVTAEQLGISGPCVTAHYALAVRKIKAAVAEAKATQMLK